MKNLKDHGGYIKFDVVEVLYTSRDEFESYYRNHGADWSIDAYVNEHAKVRIIYSLFLHYFLFE